MTSKQVPSLLFVYRPFRKRLDRDRQILIENKLWFATPDSFNDPFEARPRILISQPHPSRADLESAARRNMPDATDEDRAAKVESLLAMYESAEAQAGYVAGLAPRIADIFQHASMACFAEDPGDIRMWSYYSSGHSGYCIGFNFDRQWSYLDPEKGRIGMTPTRVVYSDEYPEVDASANLDDAHTAALAALMTKANGWAHEQEWRVFRPNIPSGNQEFAASALRVLVLGARMPPRRRAVMIKLARDRATPVLILQATMASERFELQMVPVL